jgi:hypothetical protein
MTCVRWTRCGLRNVNPQSRRSGPSPCTTDSDARTTARPRRASVHAVERMAMHAAQVTLFGRYPPLLQERPITEALMAIRRFIHQQPCLRRREDHHAPRRRCLPLALRPRRRPPTPRLRVPGGAQQRQRLCAVQEQAIVDSHPLQQSHPEATHSRSRARCARVATRPIRAPLDRYAATMRGLPVAGTASTQRSVSSRWISWPFPCKDMDRAYTVGIKRSP